MSLQFYPEHYRQSRPFVKQVLGELEALRLTHRLNPQTSFDVAARAIVEQYRVSGLDPRAPSFDGRRFTSDIQAVLTYGEWAMQGAAVYQFDARLTESLRESALGDLALSDLQYPFVAAYFHFGEQPGLTLQTGAAITGAYLLYAERHSLRIVLTAPLPPQVPWQDCFVETYDLRIPAKYFPVDIETAIDSALADDVADLRQAEEQLRARRDQAATRPGAAPAGLFEEGVQAVDRFIQAHEAHREAYRRCMQLIVNGLCYVTAFPADGLDRWQTGTPERLRLQAEQGTPKEQARAHSKLNALGYRRVHYIGQEFGDATQAETDRGLAPHWRRGFWRRQPYGPQNSMRRLTWIRPTRVMGGVVEATPRRYDVPPPNAE